MLILNTAQRVFDSISNVFLDCITSVLTSKELMGKTGISRATLNNYIALGILPRPLVKHPGPEGGQARQLGYFPDEAFDRINEVKRLKKEGLSMEEISARLGATGMHVVGEVSMPGERRGAQDPSPVAAVQPGGELKLTIDRIPHPAYMVNYNFELTWYNSEAQATLLGGFETLPPSTEARNVFQYLMRGAQCHRFEVTEQCKQLLRFHLSLAKDRLSKTSMSGLFLHLDRQHAQLLESLYNEADAFRPQPIIEMPLNMRGPQGDCDTYYVYASYYREGILFVYVPGGPGSDSLLNLLARRDEVIRNLLKRRLPVLTELAVLVADVQDSVKICAELPPEEYFELIDQIWSAMGPIFRKYYGTQGKHAGDGMVYYFFPQPDCSYIFNALRCAQEMKIAINNISKQWQLRKNWLNELYLNTGLNEGQEWLGTFQSATNVEFAVLGDTINQAARLSDFARCGSIWATKNFLGKLAPEERQKVRFGIRRKGQEGQEIFVKSTYSRVSGLVDLSSGKFEKIRDIAALPITEILEVKVGES